MGSMSSKPTLEVAVTNQRNMSSASIDAQTEQRRKALETHGILIPPAFGVTGTPSQKGTMGPSMSVNHRLLQASVAHGIHQPVGYMEYLIETDLSTCILHDHMHPGVWIAAPAAKHTVIRAGVYTTTPASSSSSSSPTASSVSSYNILPGTNNTKASSSASSSSSTLINSQLFVEQKLPLRFGVQNNTSNSPTASIQLHAATEVGSFPALSAIWHPTKSTSLFASITGNGMGWLGGHWDQTIRLLDTAHQPPSTTTTTTTPMLNARQQQPTETPTNDTSNNVSCAKPYEGLDTMSRKTINCKLGAWTPIHWNEPVSKGFDGSFSTCFSQQYTHGYAALNALGATVAVHASMPLDGSYTLPITSSYLSVNLNDVHRPPLQITLARDVNLNNGASSSSSSISLSQVLAFDRTQWNPLEDRARQVRNTAAWTICMESSMLSSSSSPLTSSSSTAFLAEDSGAHTTTNLPLGCNSNTTANAGASSSSMIQNASPQMTTRVVVGGAWQINRGIAIKAIVYPNERRCTTAIVLKRWQHPRITCSLLYSLELLTAASSSSSRDSTPIRNNCRVRFVGVGIELETGYMETNPEAYYYNYHPSPTISELSNTDGVPKTQAALPSELLSNNNGTSP